jgi:uncharacterized protein YndB with AHSA1/START domain
MNRHTFKITINASRQKVWDILWGDDTYPKWTSVFSEGSKAETDWKEGSKILFLDGKGSGMVSKIETNKTPEYMSFKHLGEVKAGVEDVSGGQDWYGSLENYSLKEANGKTELEVEMDIVDEYKDYLMDKFPQALQQVKELAEKK